MKLHTDAGQTWGINLKHTITSVSEGLQIWKTGIQAREKKKKRLLPGVVACVLSPSRWSLIYKLSSRAAKEVCYTEKQCCHTKATLFYQKKGPLFSFPGSWKIGDIILEMSWGNLLQHSLASNKDSMRFCPFLTHSLSTAKQTILSYIVTDRPREQHCHSQFLESSTYELPMTTKTFSCLTTATQNFD